MDIHIFFVVTGVCKL